MITKRYIHFLYVLVVTSCGVFQHCNAAIVLEGNKTAPAGQSFSFPIQQHVPSPNGSRFFFGAHPTLGVPEDFAISYATGELAKVLPMALPTVTLNNVQDQTSPLYNSHVAYLGLLSSIEGPAHSRNAVEHPIIVLQSDLMSVYVIDTFFSTFKNVVSVLNVLDASGVSITAGIVGVGNISNLFAVAAVGANGGSFGDVGSGLAVLKLDSVREKVGDTEVNNRVLKQVDAPFPTVPNVTRALPLDVTSAKLKITSNLADITDVVSMTWDDKLKRLYVGLQVTSGAGAGDGARAIAMVVPGQMDQFAVQYIAPDTAFSGTDKIVGSVGAGSQVSLYNIKTMSTSTNLSYLIVHGGNGNTTSNKRSVFALPLINVPTDNVLQGTLADKTQIPSLSGFRVPATTPAQMTLATETAAIVGAGPQAAGDIVDMFVAGDSVFVSVFDAAINQLPGMFYSQALLDVNGAVKAWTAWQRVGGSTDKVFGLSLDTLGNFTSIVGPDVNSLQTVKRTVWGLDSGDGLLGGLVDVMNIQFPRDQAGIQGLFNLSRITPGLNGISLAIATGLDKVLLAQTGALVAGTFTPQIGDFSTDLESFTNGTITHDLPVLGTQPKIVVVSGGQLQDIGPITQAEIGVDTIGSNGWLFVGGTNGLAVLAQADGSGWNSTTELGPNFDGLKSGMSFKKIGSYTFIRKLVYDQNSLYVMTDKTLERINLSSSNFATGQLSVTTLATVQSINGLHEHDTFNDILISGKLGLLATSKGLLRVADGRNVATATSPAEAAWQPLFLPETVGPVTKIVPISITGRAQDITSGGGQIYALNAYVGYYQAQVAIFAIADLTASPVSGNTVQLIPNFYNKDSVIRAPFVNFNGFRDLIMTDGAAFFSSLDRDLVKNPFVQIVFGLKRGQRFGNGAALNVPLDIDSASFISAILRDSASGSWLISGDFGLRVNE